MRIIIDADACPKAVLQACLTLGRQHDIPVWTVASFNHNIQSENHILVGNASQEADIKIMNTTRAKDIAVTQDYGLAAMLLSKGAQVLSPDGRIYNPETIDILLEERELKARYRRAGGRTKGPSKRTPAMDRAFATALARLIAQTNS